LSAERPNPDAKSAPPQAGDRYRIFEQAALDRLRRGSDQTKPVGFLPLPVRLAAISAIAITGMGVMWSILARVPVQVNGIATIVPETGVSSAQARVSGVLYYQVSGVGKDLLSPIYRRRNQALSAFWNAAVVNSRSTLPISQLKQLVEGAQLPAQGQRMVMPGTREDPSSIDHYRQIASRNDNLDLRQLFISPHTLIALVDNSSEVETLDALRRLIAPKLAIQRQTSQDSRKRAKSYRSVDTLIASQLRDKEKELSQRQDLFTRLQKLWSKGYISEIQLLQEQATVNGLSQEVVRLRRDRLANNFSSTDQGQQAAQADLNYLQATDQLQNGLVTFMSKSYTISPPSGLYLVAKYRQTGMAVNSGDELFTFSITPPSLPARIPVFVDGATIQQLSEGNRVLVTPKGISRAQYGGIVGVVDEVGRLPYPGDSLAAVAGGRSLASAISKSFPTPYLVKVRLKQANPRFCQQLVSIRCYAWSTSRVPPFPVRMGTQADVQITTIYGRPIDFVMPALRQALGLVVENR
jgi:hypothetical protein